MTVVLAGSFATAAGAAEPPVASKKRAEPAAASSDTPQSGAWAQSLTRRSKAATVDPRVFDGTSWNAPPPSAAPRAAEAPTVPPFPFAYAGRLVDAGTTRLFLTQGDAIVAAVQGDILDGQFRLDTIELDDIKVTYLPLKKQIVLPLASLTRQSADAQRAVGGTVTAQGSAMQAAPTVASPPPAAPQAPAARTPGTDRNVNAARGQPPPANVPSARGSIEGTQRPAGSATASFPMLPAPSGTLAAPGQPREPFASVPAEQRAAPSPGAPPEKR